MDIVQPIRGFQFLQHRFLGTIPNKQELDIGPTLQALRRAKYDLQSLRMTQYAGVRQDERSRRDTGTLQRARRGFLPSIRDGIEVHPVRQPEHALVRATSLDIRYDP